jgi:hypothetical protein
MENAGVYIPSARIWELMDSEAAGVWIDQSLDKPKLWMVAKLPMNVIRAIHVGASVYLCAWVVEIKRIQVAVCGLKIDDNSKQPLIVYSACRNEEQVCALRTLLKTSSFPLQIHNEIKLLLLHLECAILSEQVQSVINALFPICNFQGIENRNIRLQALDIIQASLDGNRLHNQIKAYCILPLQFEKKLLKSYSPTTGEVSLDDRDEGFELEKFVFELFDWLCPFGTFLQPKFKKGKQEKELCDILAVSRCRESQEEGIFVIQCKAASEWTDGLSRTTQRRSSSIQKGIMSAIGQLKGAIRTLQSGTNIYKADGSPIDVDPESLTEKELAEPIEFTERAKKVGHAIVLVSEMHGNVNWQKVADELIMAEKSMEYLFHVLDLRELENLISYSQGRPIVLEAYLVRRWEIMVKNKNAFIRSCFILPDSSEKS